MRFAGDLRPKILCNHDSDTNCQDKKNQVSCESQQSKPLKTMSRKTNEKYTHKINKNI